MVLHFSFNFQSIFFKMSIAHVLFGSIPASSNNISGANSGSSCRRNSSWRDLISEISSPYAVNGDGGVSITGTAAAEDDKGATGRLFALGLFDVTNALAFVANAARDSTESKRHISPVLFDSPLQFG